MWWTRTEHLDISDNSLQFAGESVQDIVDQHGTPVYLYDPDRVIGRYERLRLAIEESALSAVDIKFALKANNNRLLLETLRECGAGIDATSPNEVKAARECGFDDENIVFTGTSLSDDDLAFLSQSELLVNFDSVSSLERFDADAGRRIGLRINSGVGLGRSKKTTTGGQETDGPDETKEADGESIPVKFGIPYDEPHLLERAFDRIEDRGYDLDCIHHHVGSGWLGDQAFDAGENYLTAVDHTLGVIELAEQRGHNVSVLDIGGGFGVPHAAAEEPLDLVKLFDGVADRLSESSATIDRVYIEPGTYLVSDAGIFVTQVTTVEPKNNRLFVGVDSGLNSFNSFAHYDYYHEVVNCNRVTVGENYEQSVIVVGNNCESGDIFTKERSIPTTVEEGDYLAFLNAGAYGAVFRSDFNMREQAAEIVV
jgi:diaminopimelate decarboxylase